MGILHAFQAGGVFMYAILVFAVMTVALMVERGLALFASRLKMPSKQLQHEISQAIQRGDLRAAEAAANQAASPLGSILATGLQIRQNAGGDEQMQARMDERLSAEISKVDRRTGFLGMFGNVSTLLGLLGTISGMIQSFAAVAKASPADRATQLSAGISEAMNCTAFGLIVAIPALIMFAVCQNRVDRFVTALTEATTELYHDLLFFTSPMSASAQKNSTRSASAGNASAPTLSQ